MVTSIAKFLLAVSYPTAGYGRKIGKGKETGCIFVPTGETGNDTTGGQRSPFFWENVDFELRGVER